MKLSSRHVVIIGSAILLGGTGLWVGCGGDDTTTPPVDAGTDTTNNPDTGKPDTGTPDTGAPDTGTPDGGGGGDAGLPANCKDYCTLVQATCGTGANAQYLDQATCEKMCAKFPPGDAGAQSGNSFACRAYHASVAAQSANNAAIHCPHAGPYGFGGCGSETENFCFMYNAQCTGGGNYGVNCPTTVAQIADSTDGGPFLPPNGAGSRDCREYHLENAYSAGNTTGGHCDHASKDGGGVCP